MKFNVCHSVRRQQNTTLPNPDAKFAYGSICVKNAPVGSLVSFACNSEMITTISHANCNFVNMFCV